MLPIIFVILNLSFIFEQFHKMFCNIKLKNIFFWMRPWPTNLAFECPKDQSIITSIKTGFVERAMQNSSLNKDTSKLWKSCVYNCLDITSRHSAA